MANAILLISCADQKGITAAVTQFVAAHGGNILHADQHIDAQSNTFFMRIEWSLDGFTIAREDINQGFAKVATSFKMDWKLHFTDVKQRVAIFVSKHLHCLYDLLYRYASGQFSCEIPLIISNHDVARGIADEFGIAYHKFEIDKENKLEQEKKEIELLQRENIDLILLARYHQIFTKQMIDVFDKRIINIHHSFLPAFVGKSPYAQAYKKGVKIIGATSHYVTEDLDQGPIIEQDTVRISHRDEVIDLVRKGEDLEKIVFSRAFKLALEHKILCYENKTVIFD